MIKKLTIATDFDGNIVSYLHILFCGPEGTVGGLSFIMLFDYSF
jgi:hypothetical protein